MQLLLLLKSTLQVDVYTPLKAVLEHAWQMWEAQILAQPLLIVAPTASAPLLVHGPGLMLPSSLPPAPPKSTGLHIAFASSQLASA